MNIFGSSRRHLGLVAILLFAGALLVYRLTESPLTGYDEGILVQMAGNLFETGSFSLRTSPGALSSGAYMTTAFPVLLPVAVSMKLFGSTLLAARSVMAMFSLAFLACLYTVTLRTFGRKSAWLATALMATHASLYAYGKPVMGEIPGLLYIMLFLLGLHALTRRQERPLPLVVLTSLALGLAAVTKPIFLLVLPAAGLTLLLHRKRLPVTPATVIASVVTLLLCAGAWLATQFFASDDVAKVLLFYRNPYLIQDVAGTVIANLKRFVTEATPIYALGLFVVWAISFVARVWDIRVRKQEDAQPPSAVETFAFLFVILVFLAYLRTPGFYRYFFVANVMIFPAFPSALQDILRRIVARLPSWNARTVSRDLSILLCLLLIGFQGFRLFNGSFITTSLRSAQTAELEAYFWTQFKPAQPPYVYDVPELVPFLRTDEYHQWIEVSGGGTFSLGVPLEDALAAKVGTILVHEKRYNMELDRFADYHQTAMIVRYVVLERNADAP
jgi:4-amino-4-deoxy-L-arabinose transferase-like glycosyltransferase